MKRVLVALFACLAAIHMAFAALDINTAGEAELDKLPGIGPTKAKAIVEDRAKNRPFRSVEDLKRVKGIGDKTFDDLKGQITVSGGGKAASRGEAKPVAPVEGKPAPAQAKPAAAPAPASVPAPAGAKPTPAPAGIPAPAGAKSTGLMRLTVESGAPNCNRLNETLRTLPHLLLNTKTLAYELSRLKSVIDQTQHGHPELGHYGLTTKLCTAADLESSWAAYWIRQLCIPAVYHRKNWELCFVMQALYEPLTGFEGKHGLGFACGIEKIPSCLASLNAIITATDAPPGVAGVECWSKTRQLSSGRDQLFHPDLISKEAFASRVCFDFVDMNEIPDQYQGRSARAG